MKAMIDILQEAKQLVEKGWCQRTFWTDTNGEACLPKYAACCCALGALKIATNYSEFSGCNALSYYYAVEHVEKFVPGRRISSWNDMPGRTQEEVVALFDTAILNLAGASDDSK